MEDALIRRRCVVERAEIHATASHSLETFAVPLVKFPPEVSFGLSHLAEGRKIYWDHLAFNNGGLEDLLADEEAPLWVAGASVTITGCAQPAYCFSSSLTHFSGLLLQAGGLKL